MDRILSLMMVTHYEAATLSFSASESLLTDLSPKLRMKASKISLELHMVRIKFLINLILPRSYIFLIWREKLK